MESFPFFGRRMGRSTVDPRETETSAGGSSRTSPSSHGSERELGCGVGRDFRLDSTVEGG